MKRMIQNIICLSLVLVMCLSSAVFYTDAGDFDTPIIPINPGHTHSFVGAVTTEPTCTEAGVMTYTCSCGKGTYTEPIPALGHDMLIHEGAEETCTEPGNKPYCECRRCSNYYIDDQGENLIADKTEVVIAAKGHRFDVFEPYCLNGCGEVNPNYSPAHEHNYNAVVTEPTCTEAGFTTHICECGDSFIDSETPALGHDFKKVVTKATLTKNGKVVSTCSRCGEVESSAVVYYPKTIALAKTSFVVTGKAVKPTLTVKDAKGKVISKSHYTVTFKNNLKAGKAQAVITFKGNYSGTKTLKFTILPKSTTLTLSAGKKAFTAKWKKVSDITGYQIEYSTKSNFAGAKSVKVNSAKTLKKVVGKLSANKTYFVHIRTFKTVSKVNYYSAWSKAGKVKTY